MNYYHTTTGPTISQATINKRLSAAYAQADQETDRYICECCGKYPPAHHDHTISQKRCKELGRSELIYERANWSYSCARCHSEWESYKSGRFTKHLNYTIRMEYMQQHDPEGYAKRTNILSIA